MAVSCAAVKFTALVLLPFFIKSSEQICLHYNRSRSECGFLDDLYEKKTLRPHIRLIKDDKYSDLEEFRPLPLETAQNIERLEITAAINSIAPDAFANFTKIQYLIFYNNKLEEIPVGIFRNLNVKYLALGRCQIKMIAPGAFANLTKLEELRVPENNLTKININIFNNLTTKAVVLSNNQISEIEKFSFGNLPNLTRLYLDHNRLTEFISQEYLHYPEKLERLWLHVNKLTEVTVYMLEGLTKLQVLNLGFNSISSIEPKSFQETPKLRTLVLTNNHLKIITGDVFPRIGLHELANLYIDHNRLTFLPSNFLFRLNALQRISIGGNPWQCPCLDLVLRWLYDNDVQMKCDKDYLNGKRPVCVVPDRINNCIYSYNEKHFEDFQTYNKLYPSPSFCIL